MRAPYFLSVMSVEDGEKAIEETEKFVELLQPHLRSLGPLVGLQKNVTCANAGKSIDAATDIVFRELGILGRLGIPIVVKINILTPFEIAKAISEHSACDALLCSNAIGYKKHDSIKWRWNTSPLEKYGGGAISGKPLFPLVYEWITRARFAGITTPINFGGGIFSAKDVSRAAEVADGISIATVVAQRPWRLRSILERANEVFSTNEGSR